MSFFVLALILQSFDKGTYSLGGAGMEQRRAPRAAHVNEIFIYISSASLIANEFDNNEFTE